MQLVESEHDFYYHATASQNLANIQREGLTPNTDRTSTFGDGYPVNGRLYIAINMDAAQFYAKRLIEMNTKPAILRFPAAGVRLKADQFGNLSDRYTTDHMLPDRIEVLRNKAWVRLASLKFRHTKPVEKPRQVYMRWDDEKQDYVPDDYQGG